MLVLPFAACGQVGKMSANLLLVTANGSWILPFWGESRTQYDLVPSFSGVLISLDNGATWSSHGNITNDKTWRVHVCVKCR